MSTAVWQVTAVVQLVVGDKTADIAAAFLEHLRKLGITLSGFPSDNGPEVTGKPFTAEAEQMGLTHHRIPPSSPNDNAVCERFQGAVLPEFFRPDFHRGRTRLQVEQEITKRLRHTSS